LPALAAAVTEDELLAAAAIVVELAPDACAVMSTSIATSSLYTLPTAWQNGQEQQQGGSDGECERQRQAQPQR